MCARETCVRSRRTLPEKATSEPPVVPRQQQPDALYLYTLTKSRCGLAWMLCSQFVIREGRGRGRGGSA
jgi:hypothetical protein